LYLQTVQRRSKNKRPTFNSQSPFPIVRRHHHNKLRQDIDCHEWSPEQKVTIAFNVLLVLETSVCLIFTWKHTWWVEIPKNVGIATKASQGDLSAGDMKRFVRNWAQRSENKEIAKTDFHVCIAISNSRAQTTVIGMRLKGRALKREVLARGIYSTCGRVTLNQRSNGWLMILTIYSLRFT